MDLFEEIRSDMEKSKYHQIWENYGKFFIAILVAIVISISSYVIYKDYNRKENIKYSEQLFVSMQNYEAQNITGFLKQIDIIAKDSKTHHATYALIKKANHYLKENNSAKAFYNFNRAFESSNYKPYKNYAELMMNYIIFKFPAGQKNDQNIISNLDSNNIFYFQILEVRALGFFEQGKKSDAINEFSKILNEPNAPNSSKSFAAEFLKLATQND
jgi:hypothetical protein